MAGVVPIGALVRLAPADVRGGDVEPVRRGLVWWRDGTLFVASGRPDSPVVRSYSTGDDVPMRYGRSYRIGPVSVSSCGCSSPWKRVDPGPLEALAVPAGS